MTDPTGTVPPQQTFFGERGLREALLADVTALAHLTPEDWAKRRGADPIARTINAVRDIIEARFENRSES